ncbi:hypothetical protein R3P38DRAFT_514084 [Favolaschia claudopus]|uniref:Uncharacterized protein n=1 Tax=Favolaschia claudopus TaxID=2862362 RepID=A0AAV9ZCW1_9AGAR
MSGRRASRIIGFRIPLKAPKPQSDLPSDSDLKKPIPEESCHDDVLRATTQTEQFRAILDRMLAEEAELRVAITEARFRGLPGIDLCSYDKIREQDNVQKLPLQRDLPASEESKGQDSDDLQFREPGDNRHSVCSQWSYVSPNTSSEIPVEPHLSSFSLDRITIESIHGSELDEVQLRRISTELAQHSSYSLVETRSISFYRSENGTRSSYSLVEPEDQETDVPRGSSLALPFTVNYLSIGSIRGGTGGGGGQGGRDGGDGGLGAGPQLPISRVETMNIQVTGTLCLHSEAVHAVHSSEAID